MKPVNIGRHAAYQKHVLEQLCKYYPNALASFDSATWDIMEQFWSLDLSPVDDLMQDRYSVFGPEPRLPSNMLRSYLLSIKCKITSTTAWASDLKQNYLHAILSGFSVGDTPGTGTFYDFFDRLWLSDNDNISNPVHPPKQKPKKPDKKGQKAPPAEKVTVYDLLDRFEIEPPKEFDPAARLFEIFKSQFLDTSVNQGLIDLDNLAVSGDGTPVYTGARSVGPVPATAWKRAFGTVNAAESITSPTATSAGIPTGNGITLVTTFTCSLPLTPKMICRYSLCLVRLPDMIHMVFGITSSP